MSKAVHDSAVMLERVMCFGVTVEVLTKQERVDRKGGKPSSRHVPSGSYIVALDVSGQMPVPECSGDPENVKARAGALSAGLMAALAPFREIVLDDLRATLRAAKTIGDSRRAVALSGLLNGLDSFQVLFAMPHDSLPMLFLAGCVRLDPPIAEQLKDKLVGAIESVLKPERDRSIEVVRDLAMKALGA